MSFFEENKIPWRNSKIEFECENSMQLIQIIVHVNKQIRCSQ